MRKLITALFVAGLVLSGGMALASIPDAGGVIHGCYLTTGPPQARGALRVIDTDAGQACVSGEIAITWNQTGPQGPEGPAGATGPAGEPTHFYTLADGLFIPVGEYRQPVLDCDAGDVAVSGGYQLNDYDISPAAHIPLTIYMNQPAGDSTPERWRFGVENFQGNIPYAFIYFTRCADFLPYR